MGKESRALNSERTKGLGVLFVEGKSLTYLNAERKVPGERNW